MRFPALSYDGSDGIRWFGRGDDAFLEERQHAGGHAQNVVDLE
jgi:hypothetical protein